MKNLCSYLILCILSCTVFFLSSCTSDDTEAFTNGVENKTQLFENKYTYTNIELGILNIVNDFRQSNNLTKLERSDIASSVALAHTNFMIDNDLINHENFAQRCHHLQNYANASKVAEVIGYGYYSEESLVNAWTRSEEHLEILEYKGYSHFGIAMEYDKNEKMVVTLLFMKTN